MFAHNFKASVFCYQGENAEQIRQALVDLVGIDLEKEKLAVTKEVMGKDQGRFEPITIYSLLVKRRPLVQAFAKKLFSQLSEQDLQKLLDSLDDCIDDHLYLSIRLGKKELLDGVCKLTLKGDCFHVKIKLAAYPAHHDKGVRLVQEFVDSIKERV